MVKRGVPVALQFGVPQGSVLGPRIFIHYTKDASPSPNSSAVTVYVTTFFADDMQGRYSEDLPMSLAAGFTARTLHCLAVVRTGVPAATTKQSFSGLALRRTFGNFHRPVVARFTEILRIFLNLS